MMQELSTFDDLAATNVEFEPEKIEDGKDGGPSFSCDLYDTELVHKIAQGFVPGLATACVDYTSGDIFKTPASVAAEVRKEMVEDITQRSESFVAESVVLEGGGQDGQASDHPFDIISDFVDDFASSKRNLFSRVSGWLLSEKREDNIDDFVQEMEINGFWLLDKRETIAQNLLKNVDLKNEHHCSMRFHTLEELEAHVPNCSYRSTGCINEGCNAIFCASQVDKHDAVCPFKIIPCEQNCSDMIMRRDMDRHCITVCPMKLVSCPFYAVGCQSPVPHCNLEQHRSDDLHSHMLLVLHSIHKETSIEDLKRRLEQLKGASSSNNLARARDVRSLTSAVKDLEEKLGAMDISRKQQGNFEAEHALQEVNSKAPEFVESGTKQVSNKPEEDLKLKAAPKGVSQQSEYLEARSEPKEDSTKPVDELEAKPVREELSTNPAEDFEAKQAPKEVSSSQSPENVEARLMGVSGQAPTGHEAKPAGEELSAKPAEDLEAKPAPKEVSSSKLPENVEARLVGASGQARTGHEAKPAGEQLSAKPAEDLEAKPAPKEVSNSKSPDHVEARSVGVSGQAPTKSAPEELSGKPAENLEAKPAPKEIGSSKPPEDVEERPVGVSDKAPTGLEAKQEPKELNTKPAEDVEAKPATKEVKSSKPLKDVEERSGGVSGMAATGHEAKQAPKESSTKPGEDVEAKPATPEAISAKPLKDVEEKPVGVSGKVPTGHEAKQAPKELGVKPAENVEAKPAAKEVRSSTPTEDAEAGTVEASGKVPTGHEEKFGTKEVTIKLPEELETKQGTKEVGSKPPEALETQLGTKEMGSKSSEELETQLGTAKVSDEPPQNL
ncbi:uncharacterized protein LOC126795741 [Argentina anserina]|uniref:uncharacterized protein LOC126795741 n=1 Tax=Argentina anserina TaxID=57926 RepID=UPI0021764835|nr:uncharacterized protein LOC126795741 [Potentilla anserina]